MMLLGRVERFGERVPEGGTVGGEFEPRECARLGLLSQFVWRLAVPECDYLGALTGSMGEECVREPVTVLDIDEHEVRPVAGQGSLR